MTTFKYGTWAQCLKVNDDFSLLLSAAKNYSAALAAIHGSYNGFVAHLDDPSYLDTLMSQTNPDWHNAYAKIFQTSDPDPAEVLSGYINDTYTFNQPFSLWIEGLLEIWNTGSSPTATPPTGIFMKFYAGSSFIELNTSNLVDVYDDHTFWRAEFIAEVSYDLCGEQEFKMECSSGVACGGSGPNDIWTDFQAGVLGITMRPFGCWGCPDNIEYNP